MSKGCIIQELMDEEMDRSTIDVISDYLDADSRKRGIHAEVFRDSIRDVDGWLYVPVGISSTSDALETATLLQQMEDGWNTTEPEPSVKILLIPARSRDKATSNGVA
jgi:hypothetical protein